MQCIHHGSICVWSPGTFSPIQVRVVGIANLGLPGLGCGYIVELLEVIPTAPFQTHVVAFDIHLNIVKQGTHLLTD